MVSIDSEEGVQGKDGDGRTTKGGATINLMLHFLPYTQLESQFGTLTVVNGLKSKSIFESLSM